MHSLKLLLIRMPVAEKVQNWLAVRPLKCCYNYIAVLKAQTSVSVYFPDSHLNYTAWFVVHDVRPVVSEIK